MLKLRNLLQGVVRTLLSLKSETRLFDDFGDFDNIETAKSVDEPAEAVEFVVRIAESQPDQEDESERALIGFVASNLAEPTEALIRAMKSSLQSSDAVLMDMCGHRQYLGPPPEVSDDVLGSLVRLRKCIIAFSNAQDGLLASERLPRTYALHPEVVKLFAYCRPVQQAASAVEALLVKVNEMQQRRPKYPKFHLPSYPFWKSIHRTNAQVRHDRGGVTAGG